MVCQIGGGPGGGGPVGGVFSLSCHLLINIK